MRVMRCDGSIIVVPRIFRVPATSAHEQPPLYSHISMAISSEFHLNAMQMPARKAGWRFPGRLVAVQSGVEAVEPEERVLDGQNLHLAETRLAGVAAQRIGTHDG